MADWSVRYDMTETQRNARVMAVLRLLVVGALMLTLAVALTGTVAAFDREGGKEFGHNLDNAGNRAPQGVWSDGATMWVADWEDDKLYAYDLDSKARVPARDFDTLRAAGNRAPWGVWSDGTTMWVADSGDDKLYAYDLTSKARVPARDFDTLAAAGNNDPRGIWSDGTTMWVADIVDVKVYAYDIASKARVPARDFETLQAADIRVPQGIWSDGDTMWVGETRGHNYAWLFAFNVPEDLPLPGNEPPVFTIIRSIPEHATAGYLVGTPFTATDPDGDPLNWALSGADSSSFAIGRTSGQITLAAGVVLDYETKASYAVTVTVTDSGGLSATIAVTINVTDS